MYALFLNPMTSKAEHTSIVAISKSSETLQNLLNTEAVEPYKDGNFHKVYRKGGILEWFNPPYPGNIDFSGNPVIINIGTVEDWIEKTVADYNNFVLSHIEI